MAASNYRSLRSDKILDTIDRLGRRIRGRFPASGLSQVCEEVLACAREAKERSEHIARPNVPLRILIVLFILVFLAGIVQIVFIFRLPDQELTFPEFVQTLESGINDLIYVGLVIFFLVTIERRLKRGRALAALHELRALAHVIDMHQLTKDPERISSRFKATAASPASTMTAFELGRYLDYCSELLSLVGKVAAIYGQGFDDTAALTAVREIEELTTGLSRKIWQKLMVLHGLQEGSLQHPPNPRPSDALEPQGPRSKHQ